ncbi:hypothetical protein ACFV27_02345 [Streptomyces antimycoticus]|uniref:hypothetical protein n=1 Tax=Streptomyces antimycoticus TaxID=68175 RepID=UPI002570F66C|nr:hypothetical protein [Streptomyces antimycoticus]WJD99927.1 hypothetical protein QR300_30250 [Streptomyces antimycoticus]
MPDARPRRDGRGGRTTEACLVRGVDRLNPTLMRSLTGQGWGDMATDSHAPVDAEALDGLHLPRVAVSETLRAVRGDQERLGGGWAAAALRPTALRNPETPPNAAT